MMRFAEIAPVVQGTAAPVSVHVPMGVFVVMFGILLGIFLVWYVINRRNGG
jgi:hypothetical protein